MSSAAIYNLTLRNRSALVITETELRLIAAPAIIGLNNTVSQQIFLPIKFKFINQNAQQIAFFRLANICVLANNINRVFNCQLQRPVRFLNKLLKRRFVISNHDLILTQKCTQNKSL